MDLVPMSGLSVPQDERSRSGWAAVEYFADCCKSVHFGWRDQRAVLDAFVAFGKHSQAAHRKKAAGVDQALGEDCQVAVAWHYVVAEYVFVVVGIGFAGTEVVTLHHTVEFHWEIEVDHSEIVVAHRSETVQARLGRAVGHSGTEEVHSGMEAALQSGMVEGRSGTGVEILVRQVVGIAEEAGRPHCSGTAVVLGD